MEAATIATLIDCYEWGTITSEKTQLLQETLGINADGSYGLATRSSHLNALEERELSTECMPFVSTPSIPGNLTAGPGDSKAIVSWSEVTESGGIPLDSYTVTATPGGEKCVTTQTNCEITGLTNGTSYTFSVSATNGVFTSGQSSSSSSISPGIPSSVLLNLDGGDFSADAYSSGGITVDWSANQGSGSNAGAYSYYNHAFAHYYDIGGGNGHGGVAWRDDRNVEIIDITHDGTCVQLNEFKLRVENDAIMYGAAENTVELVSAVLYLYENGVLIGSQSTGLSLAQQVGSAQTTVNVSTGETGCVDQIRIAYNITGACDPGEMASPCWDEAEGSTLSVMSDDWVFNKWS